MVDVAATELYVEGDISWRKCGDRESLFIDSLEFDRRETVQSWEKYGYEYSRFITCSGVSLNLRGYKKFVWKHMYHPLNVVYNNGNLLEQKDK